VVNATFWSLYPQERDSVRTVWEAGGAIGVVWTGATNLARNGI